MNSVLLIHPFGIGDLLFATPLIHALREKGVSRLDVLLGSRTAEILANNPSVDGIFSIPKDELKKQPVGSVLTYFFKLLLKLRGRNYDTLVDLSLTREYAFWSWFVLGIRRRVGFDFKGRGNFLTDRVVLPRGGFEDQHVMLYYKELAQKLGVVIEPVRLEWFFGPGSKEESLHKLETLGLNRLEPFLAVSPGGGASWGRDRVFKQWAPEKFGRLATFLGRRWGIRTCVVVGGADETELGRRFAQTCSLQTIDATGSLTLEETAFLLSRSRCFLGNDGGLLHIAKSVECATISFFGPVNPLVYGPYPLTASDAVIYRENLECRPCYKAFRYNAACSHRACLTELTVEDAIHKLERHPLLNSRKVEMYETGR